MKVCAKCGTPKPLSEFGRNVKNFRHGAKDGKNIYCIECTRQATAESRASAKGVMIRRAARITKQTDAEKVEQAIMLGYRTWGNLRRNTHLTEEEIGIALVDLMFQKRSVRPRIINGERFYVKRCA